MKRVIVIQWVKVPVDECPFEGEAIHQDGELRPVVTETCVGPSRAVKKMFDS